MRVFARYLDYAGKGHKYVIYGIYSQNSYLFSYDQTDSAGEQMYAKWSGRASSCVCLWVCLCVCERVNKRVEYKSPSG